MTSTEISSVCSHKCGESSYQSCTRPHPSSATLRWKFTLAETPVQRSMVLTCLAASSVRRAQPTIPLGRCSLLFTSSRCSQVCSTHQVPHSPLWRPEHPWHITGAQPEAHRWPKMSKHCSKQAHSEDTETSGHLTREHLHQSWSRLNGAKLQKDTNKSSHKEREEGPGYVNCILLKPLFHMDKFPSWPDKYTHKRSTQASLALKFYTQSRLVQQNMAKTKTIASSKLLLKSDFANTFHSQRQCHQQSRACNQSHANNKKKRLQ